MKKIFVLLVAVGLLSLQAIAQNTQIALAEEQDPPEYFLVDKMPAPITTTVPQYPEVARKVGVEGMVWLKLIVDQEGRPMKVSVLKSNVNTTDAQQSASLRSAFEQAAIEAANQWKFSPAMLNGKPVKVWVTLPFKFTLDAKN